MESIVLKPTSTAQWHALLNEAMSSSGIKLCEDLESYLVFLLMRYIGKPELTKSVLALEFLEGHQLGTAKHSEILRDLGDKCLLFSGFFPGCAQRRRVKISYFVKLGRSAYGTLSDIKEKKLSMLYGSLSDGFVPMMDVLHSTREMADDSWKISPLQALELWDETQSRHALKVLTDISDTLPLLKRSSRIN